MSKGRLVHVQMKDAFMARGTCRTLPSRPCSIAKGFSNLSMSKPGATFSGADRSQGWAPFACL